MKNYNHLGYIKVSEVDYDPEINGVISIVYIKANKIAVIDMLGEDELKFNKATRICMQGDEGFCYDVAETVEQIFEQLESIHPSLR